MMPGSITSWAFRLIYLILFFGLSMRFLGDRRYLLNLSRFPQPLGGGFEALDVHYQPIKLDSQVADRFVVFVLHARSASTEIDFWQHVQSTLPDATRLLGICSDTACSEEFARRTDLSFPVARYGSYLSIGAFLQQSRAGNISICGPSGMILAFVRQEGPPERLIRVLMGKIDETRH
jgi:hypothetical protein